MDDMARHSLEKEGSQQLVAIRNSEEKSSCLGKAPRVDYLHTNPNN